MFDEHTYGFWAGVAQPYSYESLSGRVEKDIFAYRGYNEAKYLLAKRARNAFEYHPDSARIYVVNPTGRTYSGWAVFPANALRGEFYSVMDKETGKSIPLQYLPGENNFVQPKNKDEFSIENVSKTFSDNYPKQIARFWVDDLKPDSKKEYLLKKEQITEVYEPKESIIIETDKYGWPVFVQYAQDNMPLIDGDACMFTCVKPDGISQRWTIRQIFSMEDPLKRESARKEHL